MIKYGILSSHSATHTHFIAHFIANSAYVGGGGAAAATTRMLNSMVQEICFCERIIESCKPEERNKNVESSKSTHFSATHWVPNE